MTDNFIEDSLKRIDEKITKIESLYKNCVMPNYVLRGEICKNGVSIYDNIKCVYEKLFLIRGNFFIGMKAEHDYVDNLIFRIDILLSNMDFSFSYQDLMRSVLIY